MRLLPAFYAACIAAALTTIAVGQSAAPRPSVTVTSPNTRLALDPGANGTRTFNIRWLTSNYSGNIDIELSQNGGTTWNRLFRNIPNSGSQSWTISGTASRTALMRIKSSTVAAVSDTSDVQFIVFGPYYKGFPGGYCTEYAARQFDASVTQAQKLNWSGNAQAWYANANTAGWQCTVDAKKATPGSIVVWSGGGFGHVAVFRSFTRDNYNNITHINVEEQNWGTIGTNPTDQANAVTANFGATSTKQISITNLSRGSFTYTGVILPSRQ